MNGDKDVDRFRKDAKAFGVSAAGHIPGIGKALGIRDTYKKGKRLAKSTSKAVSVIKRRLKTRFRQGIRRATKRVL